MEEMLVTAFCLFPTISAFYISRLFCKALNLEVQIAIRGIILHAIHSVVYCITNLRRISMDSFLTMQTKKKIASSKFRARADEKSNVGLEVEFVLGKVENIAGKRENAGYQHFLLFPQCFQRSVLSVAVKTRSCSVKD